MSNDDEAPGWAAIEQAVDAVSGGVKPLHWGLTSAADEDGIYGVNAYALQGHWLLLTLGLSELFTKVSEDAEVSGWGFELTLRVPREAGDETPPNWPLNLLSKLSSYVFQSGRVFAPGHRMNPGGSITDQDDSPLVGLVFGADPVLSAITTPFGSVEFVTVLGVSADDMATAQQAPDASGFVTSTLGSNPLLITRPV